MTLPHSPGWFLNRYQEILWLGQGSKSEQVCRHRPSWAPTKQGGKMPGGMGSQARAGRKGFLHDKLGTHWCPCSPAAGRQPVPAAPSPAAPISPIQAHWVSGIPLGIAVVRSGSSACVRVLFALLGWTCLYLLKEPGDTGWESSASTQGCARGAHIPPLGRIQPLSPTVLGPA